MNTMQYKVESLLGEKSDFIPAKNESSKYRPPLGCKNVFMAKSCQFTRISVKKRSNQIARSICDPPIYPRNHFDITKNTLRPHNAIQDRHLHPKTDGFVSLAVSYQPSILLD